MAKSCSTIPSLGRRQDLAALDPDSSEFRQIRGGSISIVFQEPMTSLSPVHTIGDQISEALFLHRDASHAGRTRADRGDAGSTSVSRIRRARCACIRSSCPAACASGR